MSKPEHEISTMRLTSVVSLRTGKYEPAWRARCVCGWVSPTVKTYSAAENEGDEHRMAIRD
jgi:hypothetical protein